MSLWQHLDKDGNGVVSQDEWEDAFGVIDADNNGRITRKEFASFTDNNRLFDTIPKRALAVITKQDWLNFFQVLDTDGSGTLEVDELRKIEDEDSTPQPVLAKIKMFEQRAKQAATSTRPPLNLRASPNPSPRTSPRAAPWASPRPAAGAVGAAAGAAAAPLEGTTEGRTSPHAAPWVRPKPEAAAGAAEERTERPFSPPSRASDAAVEVQSASGLKPQAPALAPARKKTVQLLTPEASPRQSLQSLQGAPLVAARSTGRSTRSSRSRRSHVSSADSGESSGSEIWEVEMSESTAAHLAQMQGPPMQATKTMGQGRGAALGGPGWLKRLSDMMNMDSMMNMTTNFVKGFNESDDEDEEEEEEEDEGGREEDDEARRSKRDEKLAELLSEQAAAEARPSATPAVKYSICLPGAAAPHGNEQAPARISESNESHEAGQHARALWQVAAHEVIERQHGEVPSDAHHSVAERAARQERRSLLIGSSAKADAKSRASMDASLARGLGGGGYGTVGDHGVSQAVRKFMAATIQNGWQVICSGDEEGFEDPELEAAARRGYNSMKSLLSHGGTAVVRVGVRDTTLKLSGRSKVMFQALVPGSAVSMKDDWLHWNRPLRAAVLAGTPGAVEAYQQAVEERMNHQVGKMTTILAALREDIPADFGAIWVMTMLEAESKPEDCQKPPHFSMASFRYLGEDEFAMGAGGRGAQVATMGLKKKLEKQVTKCNLESIDYGPQSEPHPTLASLYIRAFGFASKVLGKEKLQAADDHRNSVFNFVAECRKAIHGKEEPSADAIERCQQLIEAYDAGQSELDGDKVWSLVKFAEKFAGGARSRNEAKLRKKEKEVRQKAEEGARWAYLERQAGPDAIPNEGEFELDEGKYDMMLPVFFDDMLTRGRWLCFRLEADDNSRTKYKVVCPSDDDGSFGGGRSLEDEFKQWQASQPTSDGRPLCLANLDSMPTHKLRTNRVVFNESRQKRFADAMETLKTVDRAQTLCICRFQGPIENNEEACLPKPVLYDLPTTWASHTPEPRVTLSLKALKLKTWLLLQKVLRSNFLKDSDPETIPTYSEAVKKSRGR